MKKRFICILLILLVLLLLSPAPTQAATYLTTEQITIKLNSWKGKLNGKYWNYYDRSVYNSRRTEVENNLKAIVDNGILDQTNPSNAQLGVTTSACSGSLYENGCRSNYFSNGWQCFGFAWWIEYALFQSTYYFSPNDWYVYSGSSINSISLQPGDLVRVNNHSIVVSDVSNGSLNCIEAWGGSGCKISWSPGFNWSEYTTASAMLKAAKNNGGVVYRYKYIGDKGYTVTFNANNGSCNTTDYNVAVGTKIGQLPVATRAGYIFDGWYTQANGGTQIQEDHVFTGNTTIYAHWRNDYVDLGSNFFAYMGNTACGHGVVNTGSNVELGERYSNAALWQFIRQADGSYKILSATDNQALDVYNADSSNYTNVWVYPDNSTLAQRWFIRKVNGGYVLHSASNGKALDVYYGSSDGQIGDNIQIYTASDSSSQIMYIDTPSLKSSNYEISMLTNVRSDISIDVAGMHNTDWFLTSDIESEYFEYSWNKQEETSQSLILLPKVAGSYTITITLRDVVSFNGLDTISLNITVSDTYTITFDHLNGITTDVSAKGGEKIIVPSTIPYSVGQTFLGWKTNLIPSSAVFCQPGDSLFSSASRTLYAKYQEAEVIPATETFTSVKVVPFYAHGYMWYQYTPTISTSYEIKSIDETCDNYAIIYDADGNFCIHDDDSGENNQFKITYTMEEGKTYIIGVLLKSEQVNKYNFCIDRGYEITYHANGGDSPPSKTYVYSNGGGVLSFDVPSRNGYNFVGWATYPEASIAKYAAGEQVFLDSDTTFYAVWKSAGSTCTQNGHKWTAATCTAAKTCSVCKATEGAAAGHKWDAGKVTKEPTTSETGVKTYTCTSCKTTKTETLAKKEPTVTGANRLAGADRYKTAFLAADMLKEQLKAEKFDVVVVASGTEFADALSGSYLAAVKNAPMLLVRNNKTTMQLVKDYIKANLKSGGTVYLLGGVNAVPKSMETGLDGFQIKRLGGNTRYDTNLIILKEAGVGDKDILVCTGKGFADSLSASAAERPILLVKDSFTSAQKDFLKTAKGKLYIIGGTSAVSAKVESALKAYGEVKRLGGNTRYETSVLVAQEFFDKPSAAVLAYAQNFPDGLSGGALAAAMDSPLILTASGKDTAAAKYTKGLGIQNGYVLGGGTLINDKAAKNIFSTDTIK